MYLFCFFHGRIDSPTFRKISLKEFIFREDWTYNSFTGTIELDNSRIRFERKKVFLKKSRCQLLLTILTWDTSIELKRQYLRTRRSLNKKSKKFWTSISLKMSKNQPLKIISYVLFIARGPICIPWLSDVIFAMLEHCNFVSRIRFLFSVDKPLTL